MAEIREAVYSLIVPVYMNEATLPALIDRLVVLQQELDGPLEAVFVLDGLPDRSYLVLKDQLQAAPLKAQVVVLSRNFGSFAAIRMGLTVARGEYFAVMAADLQEPPELVVQFYRALSSGECDVAIGERTGRNDPWASTLASGIFWALLRRLVFPDIPKGGVDIFGCNLTVRDALLNLKESHTSLIGLLFWVGFRRIQLPYVRLPRRIGKGAWTFRRRVRYLIDSIFSFTDLPITLMLGMGVLGILTTFVAGAIVLGAYFSGRVDVPGYTPIMLAILASVSLILFALGVIGNYVWRTFENTKQRPPCLPMIHERYSPEDR